MTCSVSLLGAGRSNKAYKPHFSTHPHSSEHQPIFILHFILALINAHMFRPCRMLSWTLPGQSLHSYPQQPHHITLHFPTQHLPVLVSLIYEFQEQFTGNTSKADSLTSFHFLLKTLPAVLTSETLAMAWALLDGSLIFPHKHCLLFPTSCLCVSSALDSLSDFNSVKKRTLFILCLLYNSLDKGILGSHVSFQVLR